MPSGNGRQGGAQPSPAGARPRSRIYRGHERRRLIMDLAMGEAAHREIARREQISLADLQDFAREHEREIAEAQQVLLGKLAEEAAGLWVSNKANRIAEYQDEIEEIRDYLAELRDNGIMWSRAHRDMVRAYLDLFRQVADELGAYPQRQSAPARQGQTVHYVIETGDTKALQ